MSLFYRYHVYLYNDNDLVDELKILGEIMKRIIKSMLFLFVLLVSVSSVQQAQAAYKLYRKLYVVYLGNYKVVKLYMKKRGQRNYVYKGTMTSRSRRIFTVRVRNTYLVKLVHSSGASAVSFARMSGFKDSAVRLRGPRKGRSGGRRIRGKKARVTVRLGRRVNGYRWKLYVNGRYKGSLLRGRSKTVFVKKGRRVRFRATRRGQKIEKRVAITRRTTVYLRNEGGDDNDGDKDSDGDNDGDNDDNQRSVKKQILSIRLHGMLKGYRWKLYINGDYKGKIKKGRTKHFRFKQGTKVKIVIKRRGRKRTKIVIMNRRKSVHMR